MSKDDISMGYSISLPRPIPRKQVFQTIMDAIAAGHGMLPTGWRVEWKWRNAANQEMRSDRLAGAVRKSRAGFLGLMLRRLARDSGLAEPALREATEEEEELFEEDEEESRQAPRRKGQGTREKEQHARRSAAAKRGWETRRRNAEAARRSAAARKGWKARRRGKKKR